MVTARDSMGEVGMRRRRSQRPQFDWRRFHEELRARIVRHDFRPWLESQGVAFRHKGSESRAPCPIHGGKSLNFSVREQQSGFSWRCYSKCGKGGDLIDLLYEMGQGSARHGDIVEQACEIVGIDYDSARLDAGGEQEQISRPRTRTRPIFKRAPTITPTRHARHVELLSALVRALELSPEGLAYLVSRGLPESVEMCAIKSATPDQWREAILELDHNEERATLQSIGLVDEEGKVHPYQAWSEEFLIFPYFDIDGGLDTLRMRAPEQRKAKVFSLLGTQNQPTLPYIAFPGFKEALAATGHILFVTEGELDALSVGAAGWPAIASPGATGWRDGWLEWCAEELGAETIIIMADGDDAGGHLVNTIRNDGVRWHPGWLYERVHTTRGILGEKDANDALQKHGQKELTRELTSLVMEVTS